MTKVLQDQAISTQVVQSLLCQINQDSVQKIEYFQQNSQSEFGDVSTQIGYDGDVCKNRKNAKIDGLLGHGIESRDENEAEEERECKTEVTGSSGGSAPMAA